MLLYQGSYPAMHRLVGFRIWQAWALWPLIPFSARIYNLMEHPGVSFEENRKMYLCESWSEREMESSQIGMVVCRLNKVDVESLLAGWIH